jgi:signal transduction histidine kinase
VSKTTSPRRWLWALLFAVFVGLLTLLATSWNVVIVRDYLRLKEFAKTLSTTQEIPSPWVGVVLGTIGFLGVLAGFIVFFIKILQEMKLNQLQSEFLSNVSHELKTPLASLELGASLLKNRTLPKPEEDMLWETFQSQLTRLKHQIDALLVSSQMQAHTLKVRIKPMSLESWVTENIHTWNQTLAGKKTVTRIGPKLPTVPGDSALLNLIFDNLIENAVKFSGASTRIEVESEIDDERWKIFIRDFGLGFSAADEKKLFKRFYRGKVETAYAVPGSGLGLSIAFSAAKTLGLKLEAKSEGIGQGACFILSGEITGGIRR